MAENEADGDRVDTGGGGQEQGDVGGDAANNAGEGQSGDAREDFVREQRTDLMPIGRLVAQKVDGHTSDCSVKLKLSVETFLTDAYRMPSWWLELPALDDCQSITRRKILLEVVPLGGRSAI
jgi:hypothetical protein